VHHIGPWTWVGMTVIVAVPAIAIPVLTRSHPPAFNPNPGPQCGKTC
jgi:hypothetical protein